MKDAHIWNRVQGWGVNRTLSSFLQQCWWVVFPVMLKGSCTDANSIQADRTLTAGRSHHSIRAAYLSFEFKQTFLATFHSVQALSHISFGDFFYRSCKVHVAVLIGRLGERTFTYTCFYVQILVLSKSVSDWRVQTGRFHHRSSHVSECTYGLW